MLLTLLLFIVMHSRRARVSRFSKPAPPARAKRLQWKTAFKFRINNPQANARLFTPGEKAS